MDYLRRLNELKDEITEMRRILHSNPSSGWNFLKRLILSLQNSKNLELKMLKNYVAALSQLLVRGDNVVLLRVDMDALPMDEESGLDAFNSDVWRWLCSNSSSNLK